MPITQQQIQAAANHQHTAAHDRNNQVRLIAGPGTGKSFTIEERVYWLLRNHVPASRIFVVSFTRASSRDLKSRIENYCHNRNIQTANSVSVTTLHSLALRILRSAGLLNYPSNPMVMDNWELKEIFDYEFSRESGIRTKRCGEIRQYHEAFWSTGQWGSPNYIPPNPSISQNERNNFTNFHYPRTQTYSCVLPGEIIRQCMSNIASGSLNPITQINIRHLIIDEYQDLNPCDLEFIHHFIQNGVVTFVAGDDDQSIYSLRFASPQGIQQFTTQFPTAGDHAISDCFRCTPSILQAASSLINNHPLPNRVSKTLSSLYVNSNPPVQGSVERWIFPSGVVEAQALAESCRDLINAGILPREILILLSNRKILERYLISALDSLQLPHERPKAESYTNSVEGRLALVILRIACNRNDYIAHRSLLSFIPRVAAGICNNIANKVVLNNLNYVNLFYNPLPAGVFNNRETNALSSAQRIISTIVSIQETDTLDQRNVEIQNILGTLQGQISQHAWGVATSNLPRDINLEELRDYLWTDTDEQEASILESVYQRLGLTVPQLGTLPQKIRIMTMHGAKGLSARVVFIPGLEEEIFPGQWRIPYPGLVLEAARLLYVSVSRARVSCILSFARNRIVYGSNSRHSPSRFIRSLGGTFTLRQNGGLNANQIRQIILECSQL